MLNRVLYQKYHSKIKLQKRVIRDNDFTYRNIIGSLNQLLHPGDKALDIGSATGTLSFYVASKGLSVDGIELSKNAYLYAKANKKKLDIKNVKFINNSIESYSTNKKYNLITCFEVLEHLENELTVLSKVNKMMDTNSIFAISVPSKNAPLYRLGLLNNFDKRVGHLRRYSLNEIRLRVNRAGFNVIRSFRYEGVLRNTLFTNKFLGQMIRLTKLNFINNLITEIDNIFLKLFGESQIVLICNKK